MTALLPEAPVVPDGFDQEVEPRDCFTCGGIHPAAVGHTGYRCLTCKTEYINFDTEWSTR